MHDDEVSVAVLVVCQAMLALIRSRERRRRSFRKRVLMLSMMLPLHAALSVPVQDRLAAELRGGLASLEILEHAVTILLQKRKSRPLTDTIRTGSDTGFMHMIYDWHDDFFRRVFRVHRCMFVKMCDSLRPYVPDNRVPDSLSSFSNQNLTTEFKVAVYLYYVGHSVDFEVLGHVTGYGRETVRRIVYRVAKAICKTLKPLWLPCRPPTDDELQQTFDGFKARRGMGPCAMTVDGTHVPWWPDSASIRNYFRNHKGWMSVNCLAWVSCWYTFLDAEIGYAARVGDAVMLQYSSMHRRLREAREKWLGRRGFVIGDGGFSLADYMIVPFYNPQNKMEKHFNFCVSSTSFFVEQTFGIWKNRFRQLRDYQYCSAKSLSWIILSTMVLHNMCMGMGDASVEDIANFENDQLSKEFMSKRRKAAFSRPPVGRQPGLCKRCERKGREVCRHGMRTVVTMSEEMNSRRNKMAWQLWDFFSQDHPDRAARKFLNDNVEPGEWSDLE